MRELDKLYYEYKEDKNNRDIVDELYTQATKLGYSIYWKDGFHNSISDEEAKSLIGYALANALDKYNPNNESKSTFATYLTSALYNNMALFIRNDTKHIKRGMLYIEDITSIDKEGKELTMEGLLGKEDIHIGYDVEMETMIDEIIKATIAGFNPEKRSHIQRYERNKKVLIMVLQGYREKEIASVLGYTTVRMVTKVKMDIRKVLKRKINNW